MTAGKYTCDECKYTNGWHVVDDSDPTKEPVQIRCPNRKMTEQNENARKLGIRQQSDRDKAAQKILEDAAAMHLRFSANNIQGEIKDAGLDGDRGVMGRAFTWALQHGLIAATGDTEPSTKKGTHGKPVAVYKSLVRSGSRSVAS